MTSQISMGRTGQCTHIVTDTNKPLKFEPFVIPRGAEQLLCILPLSKQFALPSKTRELKTVSKLTSLVPSRHLFCPTSGLSDFRYQAHVTKRRFDFHIKSSAFFSKFIRNVLFTDHSYRNVLWALESCSSETEISIYYKCIYTYIFQSQRSSNSFFLLVHGSQIKYKFMHFNVGCGKSVISTTNVK